MTPNEKSNFLELISCAIDQVNEMKVEAESHRVLVAEAIYESEKVALIDVLQEKEKECNDAIRDFSTMFYDFWLKEIHGAEQIYRTFRITVRDSMSNKYYGKDFNGNPQWLRNPEIQTTKTTLF